MATTNVSVKSTKALISIQWETIQLPNFKRVFIEADMKKKFAISTLPTAAQLFLNTPAGTIFKKPTLVQQQAWPQLLSGSDILCVAPTGSGKTLAFLLPGLIICEEAASRWKFGHKQRNDMPNKALNSRIGLRFLGYSRDNSPVRPAMLVLVPTRELAMQISKQASLVLRTKGLRCTLVIGGMDPNKEKKMLEAPTPTHMMVATPGRLIDLVHGRKVDLFSVCFVVIDEADRMFALGLADQVSSIASQIRPDVQLAILSATLPDLVCDMAAMWASSELKTIRIGATNILQTATNSRRTNRVDSSLLDQNKKKDDDDTINQKYDEKNDENATSATFDSSDSSDTETDDTSEDLNSKKKVKTQTDNSDHRVVSSLAISLDVEQHVNVCAPHKKPRKMFRWLKHVKSSYPHMRIIIFCNKISTVGTVTKLLQKKDHLTVFGSDLSVLPLHGRMSQVDRVESLKKFVKGKVNILVCTDVAARGLHIPNLTHVLNYDFPSTLELYVHRIGRVGRLGQNISTSSSSSRAVGGVALSFFTRILAPLAPELITLLKECKQKVDPFLEELALAPPVVKEQPEAKHDIASMVKALLANDADDVVDDDDDDIDKCEEDDADSARDGEDDDGDSARLFPVGYALPPWLQNKQLNTSKKRMIKQNDKKQKKPKKERHQMKEEEEETKKRKNTIEQKHFNASKLMQKEGDVQKVKKEKRTESESKMSHVLVKEDPPHDITTTIENHEDQYIKKKIDDGMKTSTYLAELPKNIASQPFHNLPLHVRLKLAQEQPEVFAHKITSEVIPENRNNSQENMKKTRGKRARGKRGGLKSKK